MLDWLRSANLAVRPLVEILVAGFVVLMRAAAVARVFIRIALLIFLGWVVWRFVEWLPSLPDFVLALSARIASGSLNPFNR